jgi:hypothetical protein
MQQNKSDGKGSRKNLPMWERENAAKVVGSFSALSMGARVSCLEDMAKMCNHALVHDQSAGAAKSAVPNPDKKSGKGKDRATDGQGPAAATTQGDPAAPAVEVVKRADSTPPMRVREDIRPSPLVIQYEGIKRSERNGVLAREILKFVNVLSSALRRSDEEAADPLNTQVLTDRAELIATSLETWRSEGFLTSAKQSFGGKVPEVRGPPN